MTAAATKPAEDEVDYRCVNGHDLCRGGWAAGPDCSYCERVPSKAVCDALRADLEALIAGAATPAMVPQPCQQQQADAGAAVAKPAHSPAPWRPFDHDSSGDDPSIFAGKHCIATVWINDIPRKEAVANGHLMAAAPDLLAALRDLYELCTLGASEDAFRNGVTDSSGTIDEGNVRASDRICAARLAIAQAEGRAA